MDLTCGHFVNPFTDIGFKIIFGQPASKELLITLLNELLAGEHRIENLIFLDKENHSDSMADAGIIYDLYCLTDTGEYIIVEMQNRFHSSFLDRTLEDFLLSEPMQENYGSRYKLSTVYGIFLMNFREPGLEEKFRTDTVIADRESGKVVNPHFRQIFLQFPYFTKELKDCETLYDKLIYTLKNMQHWNRMPDALKEQVFSRLEELAAVANLSLEDRIAYDKALDRYRVSRIVEEDAREAGWKKGLAEGRAEGLAEGQAKEKVAIARNLKSLGLSTAQIAQATGLTEEEVESTVNN